MLIKYCVKEFLEDRKFKNLSNYTIKMYRTNLNIFYDFCIERELVNVEDVSPINIKQFFAVMKEEHGNNVGTINNKIRNLKSFFNYLIEEEIITEMQNPMRKIKAIKEEINIEVPTEQHVKQIIRHYEREVWRNGCFLATRNRMIIIFLISTGVRRGELVNIKWSDIDFQTQTIKVFGKKRQLASIPMSNKLKKELAEYRVICEQYFGKLGEYVFCSKQNRGITGETVSTLFKRLRKDLNLRGVKVSCHAFRHYFASKAIQNGLDMTTLQKILRHENPSMTQRYINLWGTALRDQNEKYNPINNLDL